MFTADTGRGRMHTASPNGQTRVTHRGQHFAGLVSVPHDRLRTRVYHSRMGLLPPGAELLLPLLHDEDRDVRSLALNALRLRMSASQLVSQASHLADDEDAKSAEPQSSTSSVASSLSSGASSGASMEESSG